jgi:hypothetical protein
MEDPILQTEMEVAHIPTEEKEILDGVEEGDSSSDEGLKKVKPTDVVEDGRDDGEPFIDAPMREFTYSGGIFKKQSLAFNPLTSFIGFAVLWSVSIW